MRWQQENKFRKTVNVLAGSINWQALQWQLSDKRYVECSKLELNNFQFVPKQSRASGRTHQFTKFYYVLRKLNNSIHFFHSHSPTKRIRPTVFFMSINVVLTHRTYVFGETWTLCRFNFFFAFRYMKIYITFAFHSGMCDAWNIWFLSRNLFHAFPINLIDFIFAIRLTIAQMEVGQHRIAYIVHFVLGFCVEWFFIFSACQKRRRRIKANECSKANRQSIPNHSHWSNRFLCIRYTPHVPIQRGEISWFFMVKYHNPQPIKSHWQLW